MQVAVYAIAKNEAKFVERWYNSSIDADYHLIVDTGSTDNTVDKAVELGVNTMQIRLQPWRFDDARNFSLMLLPEDIDLCICLDMDEVLVPGWRGIIEKLWDKQSHRLRYNYVWNWVDDKPGVTYYADKIHARHGFRWVNPVHEVLKFDLRLGEEKQQFIPDTLILHYADESKSRSDYLPLLALSVQENPLGDRNAHYYARELFFNGEYKKAIKEFERHLDLPTAKWNAERAASYRYMGDCYWGIGDKTTAINCFKLAILEDESMRENYVSLAQAYRALESWDNVIVNCEKALSIKDKPNSYINQPNAWSSWPNEMLAEAKRHV